MSGRRRRGGDDFADDFADEYADERPWAPDESARPGGSARGERGHGRHSGTSDPAGPLGGPSRAEGTGGGWGEPGPAGGRGSGRGGRRRSGHPPDVPRQPGPQESQPSRSMGYDPEEARYALRPSSPAASRDREPPAGGAAPGGRFPAGRPSESARSRRPAPDPPPTPRAAPAPYSAGNRYRGDSGAYPPADTPPDLTGSPAPYPARTGERAGRGRRGEDNPGRRAPSGESPGGYRPDPYEAAPYENGRGYADDPLGGYGQSRPRRRGRPDDLAGPAPHRGAAPGPYADRQADPRDGYPDDGYGQSRAPRRGRSGLGPDAPPPRRAEPTGRAGAAGPPDRPGGYAGPDDQSGDGLDFLTRPRERRDGYAPGNVEYYEEPEGGRSSRGGGRRNGHDGAGEPPGRRRRGRWAGPSAALVVVLIVLVPLAVGGFFAYRAIESHYNPPNYSGSGTGSIIFEVKPGDNATTVGNRLVTDGVVASARALELAAEHSTNSAPLEPGFYRLHKHMNATLAWNLLLSPSDRVQNKVTIPEGYRVSQTLATLSKESGIPASDFASAIKNTAALHLPSYAKGNPEGYLYPDTYEVQPGMTATQVLQQMVSAFNNEAASVNLPQAAAHGHLTPAEAITVASLAQAEGGRVADFPKIARVIYNRLDQHMPLDLDSTVMFALNTYGIAASYQQLRVNSPYNTYTHQGLPPGPIDSPGNAAIEAALHPASGNWLYFVTVNPKTGQTDFTNSVAVFNQLKAELERNLSHGG
jgi:UPF0755 protein